MEVGRRSLSSKNEFRERSGRNKMGALPLAMVLSFNDRDVHPDCPNVSNPYHKCGRLCLLEIPRGKNFLDVLRSDGDQEREKKSEKMGVNPNCPHASNPYHKCAEYCLAKLPEKLQDAGKDQAAAKLRGSKEGEKVVNAKTNAGFHPHCKHASNPNHECAESCFQSVTDGNIGQGEKHKEVSNKANKSTMRLNRNASSHNKISETCFEDTPKKEHLKGAEKPKAEIEIRETVEQIVNLEYKNASNPSHLCPEFCSEIVCERDRHEQAIKPKEESEIIVFAEEGMNLECRNVSNPDHACAAYCYQSVPEKERFRQTLMQSKENKEAVFPLERVNPQCKYASNAYHVCAEYCLQNVPNGRHPERSVMKSREEKEVVTSTPVVDLDCKHLSKPYNVCAEHCSENFLERDPPQQTIKNLKEEDILVLPSERRVNPECKFASNPYHVCAQYCLQNAIESEQHGQALVQSKENKEAVFPLERVNPQCKYASNAYHVCAEYCLQNVPNGRHPERSVMKSREEKKVVTSTLVVDLDCKHLSNQYKVCAELCSKNVLERDPSQQTIMNLKEKDIVVLPSERRVSPECKFASNPYHVCAEYCLQNAIESEQHGQVMKLKSLKELKNLVSNNKRIISGHPQCQYASNPYHQCAEYCFNKNIPGIKLPNGVLKTNERKKEKRNACRRDENLKYKNASNSFHRCAEYCPEEISPKNEAVEGSTATVEKKKRNSSKENESRDPTDMPPLHDSTDLFHEWAKYCSQTKVADQDEIVKQAKKAGIGESTRRNGKGDCFQNYYGSANMEKVEATRGFPRSLLISLFFLVGFLLGLLRWSRVIYSLVMSSEKNEKPERMKQGMHLDPKCEKVYDPYHKSSHYC